MSFSSSASKRGVALAKNLVSTELKRPSHAHFNVQSIASQHNSVPLPINRRLSQSQTSPQQQQRRSFFSLPDITKLANLVPGQSQPNADADAGASRQSSGGDSGVSSSIETDGEVQRFHARKILPYSQTQLYSLVSDVPSYSSFIPFCNSSTVLSRPASPTSTSSSSAPSSTGSLQSSREWAEWTPGTKPFEVLAELAVGFGGLEERYVSKVVGKPFESVTAIATKQTPLFKSLITRWSFAPASSQSPHLSFTPTSSSSSTDPNVPVTPGQQTTQSPDVGPTLLTIDLAFNFANPLHRIASQAVLPKVAEKMIEAFEKRCLKVYGKGTQ
ncbi:hypothetical protein I316_03287 [Kwoniella heveanensis BCC8398]|uniref:Coenzyme Q-binding protein COQ10 START domain-containing protein n=1 Tax=Kwoniella heveanensis BCC8398 TaxID=1296120 RepID=A0A1B9GW31_9TREE|nr:hypothetical protein I316_03287 [Kwoniella heveanensis BCC8398]